jgi:hypothetical protein
MDNLRIVTLSSNNKRDFLTELENALCAKFNTDRENLPDNYGDKVKWGLLATIQNHEIDTYQLIYNKNKIWTGSGGIIRFINNDKVYQGLFRGFANIDLATRKGLIGSSPTFRYMVPHQIDRAKRNDCSKVIFSYNGYNHKLFMAHKYLISKELPHLNFTSSPEPIMFNNVPQWILELIL